jgi:hypothetical protein
MPSLRDLAHDSVFSAFCNRSAQDQPQTGANSVVSVRAGGMDRPSRIKSDPTLLDGTNVRLNWNIKSDLNVCWIKFKNFLSFY